MQSFPTRTTPWHVTQPGNCCLGCVILSNTQLVYARYTVNDVSDTQDIAVWNTSRNNCSVPPPAKSRLLICLSWSIVRRLYKHPAQLIGGGNVTAESLGSSATIAADTETGQVFLSHTATSDTFLPARYSQSGVRERTFNVPRFDRFGAWTHFSSSKPTPRMFAYDQQRTSIAKLQGALYQPSNQVELISLSENKQITVWGDTRNKADHGKFAEITQTEVTAMVIGVRAFVDKHLP